MKQKKALVNFPKLPVFFSWVSKKNLKVRNPDMLKNLNAYLFAY